MSLCPPIPCEPHKAPRPPSPHALPQSLRPPLLPVQRFISEDRLPHLLLYGPPGTGKTSTILACARQLYREREFSSMVLEVRGGVLGMVGGAPSFGAPHPSPPPPSPQLNASDDRGIDIVRGPILSFASTRTIFKWVGGTRVEGEEEDAGGRDKDKRMRTAVRGQQGGRDAGPKGKGGHGVFPRWEEASLCAVICSPAASKRQLVTKLPHLALSQERLQARHPG